MKFCIISFVIILIDNQALGQDICQNNIGEELDVSTNKNTVIRLSDNVPNNLKYKWDVSYNKSKCQAMKQRQRCNLMAWEATRNLQKFLATYKVNPDKPDVVIDNSMVVPGMEFTLNLTIMNGTSMRTSQFIVSENTTATTNSRMVKRKRQTKVLGKVDVVGPNNIYADVDLYLIAKIIVCFGNVDDVKMQWEILTDTGQRNLSYTGTQLVIPSYTLAAGTKCRVRATATLNFTIVDTTFHNVDVGKRGLEVRLNVKTLTVGIRQPIKIIPTIKNPDDFNNDFDFEWSCKYENQDCENFEGNTAILDLRNGFSKPGRYELTIKAEEGGDAKTETVVVNVLDKVSRSIEIYNAITLVDISKPVEIIAKITNLVKGCLVEWQSLQENGYSVIDFKSMPGYQGVINVTTREDTILDELVETDSESTDRDFMLTIPTRTGNWPGLEDDKSYLIRLQSSCTDDPRPLFVDIPLTTNAGPRLQSLQVNPTPGTALITKFTFSTERASDAINDYPLLYKYGYELRNKSLYFVVGSDLYRAETILPYADSGIQTILNCCDNKGSCTLIKGPVIDVKIPNQLSEEDENKVRKLFAVLLSNGDYMQAINYAIILLETYDKFSNDLLKEDMEEFVLNSVIQQILNMINLQPTPDSYKRSANELIKAVISLADFVKLPEDLLTNIVKLRVKVSDTIRRERIMTDEENMNHLLNLINAYRNRNIESFGVDDVRDYLETLELVILHSDVPTTVENQKNNVIIVLDRYLGRLCSLIYAGQNIKIDLRTMSIVLEQLSNNHFTSFAYVPSQSNPFYTSIKIKFLNKWKQYTVGGRLCVAKGIFNNYFGKRGYSYMVDIYDGHSHGRFQPGAELGNHVIFEDSKDPAQTCTVFDHTNWNRCRKIEQNGNGVYCECNKLGYYGIEFLSYQEITTIRTTVPQLSPSYTTTNPLVTQLITKAGGGDEEDLASVTTTTEVTIKPLDNSNNNNNSSDKPDGRDIDGVEIPIIGDEMTNSPRAVNPTTQLSGDGKANPEGINNNGENTTPGMIPPAITSSMFSTSFNQDSLGDVQNNLTTTLIPSSTDNSKEDISTKIDVPPNTLTNTEETPINVLTDFATRTSLFHQNLRTEASPSSVPVTLASSTNPNAIDTNSQVTLSDGGLTTTSTTPTSQIYNASLSSPNTISSTTQISTNTNIDIDSATNASLSSSGVISSTTTLPTININNPVTNLNAFGTSRDGERSLITSNTLEPVSSKNTASESSPPTAITPLVITGSTSSIDTKNTNSLHTSTDGQIINKTITEILLPITPSMPIGNSPSMNTVTPEDGQRTLTTANILNSAATEVLPHTNTASNTILSSPAVTQPTTTLPTDQISSSNTIPNTESISPLNPTFTSERTTSRSVESTTPLSGESNPASNDRDLATDNSGNHASVTPSFLNTSTEPFANTSASIYTTNASQGETTSYYSPVEFSKAKDYESTTESSSNQGEVMRSTINYNSPEELMQTKASKAVINKTTADFYLTTITNEIAEGETIISPSTPVNLLSGNSPIIQIDKITPKMSPPPDILSDEVTSSTLDEATDVSSNRVSFDSYPTGIHDSTSPSYSTTSATDISTLTTSLYPSTASDNPLDVNNEAVSKQNFTSVPLEASNSSTTTSKQNAFSSTSSDQNTFTGTAAYSTSLNTQVNTFPSEVYSLTSFIPSTIDETSNAFSKQYDSTSDKPSEHISTLIADNPNYNTSPSNPTEGSFRTPTLKSVSSTSINVTPNIVKKRGHANTPTISTLNMQNSTLSTDKASTATPRNNLFASIKINYSEYQGRSLNTTVLPISKGSLQPSVTKQNDYSQSISKVTTFENSIHSNIGSTYINHVTLDIQNKPDISESTTSENSEDTASLSVFSTLISGTMVSKQLRSDDPTDSQSNNIDALTPTLSKSKIDPPATTIANTLNPFLSESSSEDTPRSSLALTLSDSGIISSTFTESSIGQSSKEIDTLNHVLSGFVTSKNFPSTVTSLGFETDTLSESVRSTTPEHFSNSLNSVIDTLKSTATSKILNIVVPDFSIRNNSENTDSLPSTPAFLPDGTNSNHSLSSLDTLSASNRGTNFDDSTNSLGNILSTLRPTIQESDINKNAAENTITSSGLLEYSQSETPEYTSIITHTFRTSVTDENTNDVTSPLEINDSNRHVISKSSDETTSPLGFIIGTLRSALTNFSQNTTTSSDLSISSTTDTFETHLKEDRKTKDPTSLLGIVTHTSESVRRKTLDITVSSRSATRSNFTLVSRNPESTIGTSLLESSTGKNSEDTTSSLGFGTFNPTLSEYVGSKNSEETTNLSESVTSKTPENTNPMGVTFSSPASTNAAINASAATTDGLTYTKEYLPTILNTFVSIAKDLSHGTDAATQNPASLSTFPNDAGGSSYNVGSQNSAQNVVTPTSGGRDITQITNSESSTINNNAYLSSVTPWMNSNAAGTINPPPTNSNVSSSPPTNTINNITRSSNQTEPHILSLSENTSKTNQSSTPIQRANILSASPMTKSDQISLIIIGVSILGIILLGIIGAVMNRVKRERTIETTDNVEFPRYANIFHQDTLEGVPR